MRLNVKEANQGDTRTIEKFLWTPLKINGETRWLERAKWEEEYWAMRNAFTKMDAGWRWVRERWLDD